MKLCRTKKKNKKEGQKQLHVKNIYHHTHVHTLKKCASFLSFNAQNEIFFVLLREYFT